MPAAHECRVRGEDVVNCFCPEEETMMRTCTRLLGASLLTGVLSVLASAQQTFEFLPEVDAYYKLDSTVRLSFQAKQTREDGDETQAEVGPSIDFLLKPLLRLKRSPLYDLDEAKSKALALSFGYRYVTTPDKPAVNRIIFEATPNQPLKGGLLISDRNRGELNYSAGDLTWRYRNRLTIQRAFAIHSYHPIPYGSVEVYYDSKYKKWSSTDVYAGCRFPIRKRFQIDPYYEHENNTGKKPNQQVNALGLILNVYF
jgi:hypothetical protein